MIRQELIGFIIHKNIDNIKCLMLMDHKSSYFEVRLFNWPHSDVFQDISDKQFFKFITTHEKKSSIIYTVETYMPNQGEFELFAKETNNFQF